MFSEASTNKVFVSTVKSPLIVAELKVPSEVIVGCAASIFKVTSPDDPPPDKPVPATTELISPGKT